MQAFRRLESAMLPIARSNVDTDQITPARYLQKPRSCDFGEFLFRDLRFARDGTANPAFPLNQPAYEGAQVVVAQDNFGCGSSREHAVWALSDYGIRAVIAPSFGDIFRGNALKNGLLPIVLPAPTMRSLLAAALNTPGARVIVDLETQSVTAPDGSGHHFEIDPRARHCLMQGIDEIDYTLTRLDAIADFERQHALPGQG